MVNFTFLELENQTTEVSFNLQKMSERYVKKFNASSCVFRASMEQNSDVGGVKVKDIMNELSSLFTDAIEQV